MIKKFLSMLIPPVFIYWTKPIRKLLPSHSSKLFDGNDAMFKKVLMNAEVYGEYGCGASTIWVAKNTTCQILSVDTSSDWIAHVESNISAEKSNHSLHHSDLGPLLDWGFPEGYEKCDNFEDYTNWIWSGAIKPDCVLIDGRFRVCSFLTCLVNADPGTSIIFDDYSMRKIYHIVENFVKPSEMCGRQALFIVPHLNDRDRYDIDLLMERFRYVRD
jgi:hypothetical protein